ncbi:PepSY-associated TM helix domain-containing protein [Ottowia thiooxydans]|uniref:PepSY-associated TM helix domain-containing protein n=1 Tax=Ottowia thiooxydans TaxID=219182 RepID=UPI000406183F|nr:PepSY-associated TM helix domain-containing protein [Ottowia thiooxydans]
MKEQFRQSMAWLHTWGSLVSGWLLYFIFVCGTATVFHLEITRWMQPERALVKDVPAASAPEMIEHALAYLERHAAGATRWDIFLPHDKHRHKQETRSYLAVGWESSMTGQVNLDPGTGSIIAPVSSRATKGGDAFMELHSELHYMAPAIGIRIAGVAAVLALTGIATGVIVHRRVFKDFFTFRPGRGQRSWLDGHNVAGVMGLPFFVMIIYSGLVYFDSDTLPVPIAAIYGVSADAHERFHGELPNEPEPSGAVGRPVASIAQMFERAEHVLGRGEVARIIITNPGSGRLQVDLRRPYGSEMPRYETADNTLRFDGTTGARLVFPEYGPGIRYRWFLLSLHDGWFADAWMLWLYLLSGLLGCVMIGSGLTLWVIKRRAKHAQRQDLPWGITMVARLNLAFIAGLPVAIAAFFWANRLLPLGMPERAEWELHCLFFTWGWLAIYSLWRSEEKAWVEVLMLASAAFGFIPLLNALTTDRHLGVTILAGDWGLAGFDLSMLILALCFGAIARRLHLRWARPPNAPGAAELAVKRELTA